MTGGTVLVLGETGRNFGAGMTNGVAYVLDEADAFPSRLNGELVQASRLMDADELSIVYELVREHFEKTGSRRAEAILDVWDVFRGQFWKVAPRQASIAAEASASARAAKCFAIVSTKPLFKRASAWSGVSDSFRLSTCIDGSASGASSRPMPS